MNTKLIPLNVSIRKDQLEQQRKQQREQINQRWTDQHFIADPEPSDKRSAFSDKYMASAYAKVLSNQTKMKDEMVHATNCTPYTKTKLRS